MAPKSRVFLGLGECMVELSPLPDGNLRQGFAGDVFNTLWYCARLLGPEWQVRFHTALGRDDLSKELASFAAKAGIDCSAVPRLIGAAPGLYMIRLHNGERSFVYWRGQSAARRMMEDAELVARQISAADLVYVSGITLAILPPEARVLLISLMAKARSNACLVAFDPNIRPALWEDTAALQAAITHAAGAANFVLPSFDDEAASFGDDAPEATVARYRAAGAERVIVKDGGNAVVTGGVDGVFHHVTPALSGPTIDSTAAGDSFNAGFLSAFIATFDIDQSVRMGQMLAARVIQGRGALVDGAVPAK